MWDNLQYVHTSGTYRVIFDMTGQMKSHNFGVNLAYVPHVCTYYFSFFRAIGTYPYVFGAHKNVWSKRYRMTNVSTPRTLEILVDFLLRKWIFLVRNFDQHEISPKSRFRNLKLISALRHIFRTYLYIFIKLYMMCTHQAQNIWKRIFENLMRDFLSFFVFWDFYGKF